MSNLADVQAMKALKLAKQNATSLADKASKANLIANVVDYGAVQGAGASWQTNYTAFQNALAAANIVRVPAGLWVVPQIILTSGKRLIGDGSKVTTIQFPNDSTLKNSTQIGTKQGIIYIDDSPTNVQKDIQIEGIKIDGNWNWATSANIKNIAHGIATRDSGSDDTFSAWEIHIRDVEIYNTPGDGIHVGDHIYQCTFDKLLIYHNYGHGIYIPRISDSIFTDICIYTTMKSGIWQGEGTDNLVHGGNNKYSNIKVYFAGNGLVRGYYPDNYPAVVIKGAISSGNNLDIQQNFGDGLVLGCQLSEFTGLLLDSNGTINKTDSANLRIASGFMYSRLTGRISGNRFTSSSVGAMRTKYGVFIETGQIGYNKYDLTVDEMVSTRSDLTAYADGYSMTPYSYVISDPTSSLQINGREQFSAVSTIVPSLGAANTNFLSSPTLSGSNGAFTVTIHAGEDSTTSRSSFVSLYVYSTTGTNTSGKLYDTSLATAKYLILWFRCKSDYPIQISTLLYNYYNAGSNFESPSTSNIKVRDTNYSGAYRDMMIYVPVNTVSGATSYVYNKITFTLPTGVTVQNRDYVLTIDNLKYTLI